MQRFEIPFWLTDISNSTWLLRVAQHVISKVNIISDYTPCYCFTLYREKSLSYQYFMIHHHIKFWDPDNVFKSKMAYTSLAYGAVSISKYISVYKFSFALPYIMANLVLVFFNCKYIVVHRPQSDTCKRGVCVCVCVCVCVHACVCAHVHVCVCRGGTCRGLLAIGRTTGLLLVGATDYPTSTRRLITSHISSRLQWANALCSQYG
jgi:hypothetical protein